MVTSVSPLLLHHADQVAFLQDGTVADVGTHDELLARNAGSRHVVVRALDDAGVQLLDVGLRRPTLDDVFLTLTGASS